jgi:23S rRNA (cytidine1920-2'-O)/16S rRNA (cytidine1409-2'-O)-methyltransferase
VKELRKAVKLRDLIRSRFPDLTKDSILAHILCGDVLVDGEVCRDPDELMDARADLELNTERAFVSRGGEKLDPLLKAWQIDPRGLVFIDVGSSRGGFTDCLLRSGAEFVHAVDVGYNQLDYSLRYDRRVKVHERTNIMTLNASGLIPPADAAVMDLSFRSIHGASSHVIGLVGGGWIISLVKPQFEWREPPESFDGVVRDRWKRAEILCDLVERLWKDKCYTARVAVSSLRGRRGNVEFFFLIRREVVRARTEVLADIEHLTSQ